VQRAVVLLKGDSIEVDDLTFGPPCEGDAQTSSAEEMFDMTAFLADRPMAEIERVAILATLASARCNKTEAARRLGLTARTLSNKMKLWRELGLVA
jgi:two-component system response regulator HydG